jgi:hypothetical protein
MKKYKPVVIPRKRPNNYYDWFDLLDAANIYSVQHRELWQEKGSPKVSGWCVMTPKGNLMPSTFSVRRNTAKSRCLDTALQKFKGIIPSLFSEWEKVGYKLVKVKWEEG